MKFTIEGQIKSGKNNMVVTRTGRHFPKREWAEWRDGAVRQLMAQTGGYPRIGTPVRAVFHYWAKDLRRRDVPGMMDAIFHCMDKRQAHLVEDDSLIVSVQWEFMGLDRDRPRLDVELVAI